MDVALLIARVGLAAIFAGAAVAKLADRSGTRKTLTEFGLPARLAAPGQVALPAVELAIAALLLPAATARWGGLAAAVTLLVFSAAIARSLARGEEPDCNCFGTLHSAPIGRGSLLRNLALAAVAGVIAVAGPGARIGAALAGADAALLTGAIVIAAALAFQGWLSYQLFRQNGRLIERVRALEAAVGEAEPTRRQGGLPERSAAPNFELPDLDGRHRSLAGLLAGGRPVALAFSDPSCAACQPMLAKLAHLRADRGDELAVAVVTRGDVAENRRRLNGHAFDAVLLQNQHEVAEVYHAHRVPSAVIIGADGRIASSVAVGERAIELLLADTPVT